MSRSPNRWTILFLVVAAGCAAKQEAVFVDVGLVVSSETIPSVKAVAAPPPAATFPAATLSLPALPAATYRLSSDKERIRQVQEVIKLNREQALKDIAARLHDAYMRDVRRLEAQRLAELKPEQQARFTEFLGAGNSVFQMYASKRGMLAARLALLAGFPDTDPTSQRQPSRISPYINRRFAEAKTLRAEIAAVDKDYQSNVAGLFSSVEAQNAADIARVHAEIQAQTAVADAKAQAEAQKEVSKEQAQLQSVLADKGVVNFPAEPGRTVTVQGSQRAPALPVVDVPGKADMQRSLQAAIESDLKIWAGVNGYVVSSSRSARNATNEFMQWRKTHLAIR